MVPSGLQDPRPDCESDRIVTHLELQTPGMGVVAEGTVAEGPLDCSVLISCNAGWEPPQEAVSTCCGALWLPSALSWQQNFQGPVCAFCLPVV